MSLFRYRGSKIWWYDFQFAGERVRASTKTRSKTLAAQAERARRRELEQGFNRVAARQAPTNFNEAAQEYLRKKKLTWADTTYVTETLNLQKLCSMFGSRLVTDFHPEDVKAFQEKRLADGAKPKTINLEVGSLRAILRRNKTWAAIQPDVRPLPIDDEPGIALDKQERERLIKACKEQRSPYLGTMVELDFCTGLRKVEVTRIGRSVRITEDSVRKILEEHMSGPRVYRDQEDNSNDPGSSDE